MGYLFGSAATTGSMVTFGGVALEAVFVYGLAVFLIGLIGWSKYNEPPLPNAYLQEKPGQRGLPEGASHADIGPAVAVPVIGADAATRREP
jgi:hypothetical protein